MKVKCIRLFNDQGQEIEFSAWLTIDKIYHVMSILIDANGSRSYRIVTKDTEGEWPDMGIYHEKCFEIISDIVPSNWHVKINNNSLIIISPKSWQEENFLENFYDHNPQSYKIFKKEKDIILKEDY
jgi:hypothetical protein